jgi:hypothetical protein
MVTPVYGTDRMGRENESETSQKRGSDKRTFRMDGSQVGVFEEGDKERFGCLLQGHNGRRLETQVSLRVCVLAGE